MNDFEVLSRDVAESVAPVEPKRDAETPQEPETVRRVRVGLDALTAELAEAKETVAYLEARENELLAEKAELAKLLDETQKKREEFAAEARLAVKRFRNALDAARNDVAIYRRAALWFAAATLSAVVAWGAAAF
ncbi:MAG: hypothetical protein IJE97_07875 [Thermoguttaceae bacterium]|nr:hypothetical protein [Thermoguttaceae bacterium]